MNCKPALLTIATALLLPACASKYSTGGPPTTEPAQPAVVEPEPTRPQIRPTTTVPPVEAVQSLPAAVALRDQAAVATAANDHARAIGLLERALRISPNDPQTFYELALSHLTMKQPQQALQLARRGLSLDPTNEQKIKLERLTASSEAML